MRLLTVTRVPGRLPGLRVTVAGCRIHHGLIGLLLLIHDRGDWRRWLPDLWRRP